MNLSRYEGLDRLRVISSFGVVFLHVHAAVGTPGVLEWFLKFRDFALPAMVMSSFFVLTISLMRKPDTDFAGFFSRRRERFWTPLIVWTLIYSLATAFAFPALLGSGGIGSLPSPIVFFTGYRHLWFLQFIFIGSLLVFPAVYWLLGRIKLSQSKLSVFCFGAAFAYGLLFYSLIRHYTDWENFSPEADINLIIFVSQVGNYILYIPIAVGIGLLSGKITELFTRPLFRGLSLALVFVALPTHIWTSTVPWTREIFGVAVFLAALQPWKKISSRFFKQLSSYSYGIYIVHFLPVQILWIFANDFNYQPGSTALLAVSVVVYFASFALAVLIRKLFPADWLIPLVTVGGEKTTSR